MTGYFVFLTFRLKPNIYISIFIRHATHNRHNLDVSIWMYVSIIVKDECDTLKPNVPEGATVTKGWCQSPSCPEKALPEIISFHFASATCSSSTPS